MFYLQYKSRTINRGQDTFTLDGADSFAKNNHLVLTPTEFHLMDIFLEKPEILLTREQLVQKVWETDASVESKNLDNYIYFLRKRIRTVESECVLSSVYGSVF